MAELSAIKTEVISRISRDTTQLNSLVEGFINDTIRKITKRKNFWFMKTTQEVTLEAAINPPKYNLPDGFKELDTAYIATTSKYKELVKLEIEDAIKTHTPNETQEEPSHIVIEEGVYTILPRPAEDTTLLLVYYQRIPELSDAQTTNFLSNNYPEILVYGGVYEGFCYLQEPEDAALWQNKLELEIKALEREHNSRILAGELSFVPKTDVNSSILYQRGGINNRILPGYY